VSKVVPAGLPASLALCNTEEEVKSEFARAFKFKLDTRQRMDLYTSRILFEFKYDKNLKSLDARAYVVAQTMYYIRELKYGKLNLAIPAFICVVDKNEAFFVETTSFKSVYDSSSENFDWDRAPSTPCPNVVASVRGMKALDQAHIYALGQAEDFSNFCRKLDAYRHEQLEFDLALSDKKQITERNFEAAYSLWVETFGPYLADERKLSEYFMLDIQLGKTQILEATKEVAFDLGGNMLIRKPIPLAKYENFWNTYEKCPDQKAVHAIWQRVDRLSNEDFRRFTGEFYTPVEFAGKAISYIGRELGERWWDNGYRLWDVAAGTGNLEYELPEEALPFCYISTLLEDDAKYCASLYPEATVFQYDYLNDDVSTLVNRSGDLVADVTHRKMPANLVADLANPDVKWIIFINPPFATANVAQTTGDLNKDGVAQTLVRKLMTEAGLGETSRELFSQFLYRIGHEFKERDAYLAMFSKVKYVNSNNDQKLRDNLFRYTFISGFCFPSKAFSGNKGDFPVGFLLWDMSNPAALEDQDVTLDIFDINRDKVGSKRIPSVERGNFMSKWVERPRTDAVMPPFSNAITVALGRKDVRDRVAPGFLCSLMVAGNDYQHQNITYLLSGPSVSAGAFSVTPNNFEQAMVVHAVRMVKKATWLNDRDQWMAPSADLPIEFIQDCVMWSLFASSNQTAAIPDVDYQGKKYKITNQLFAFTRDEVKSWRCSLSTLKSTLDGVETDRFAALWLQGKVFSVEAAAVFEEARAVYKKFFAESASLPWPQYKISRWDTGWYQVRRSLVETGLAQDELRDFANAHKLLGFKIANQLEALGFVLGSEKMFADEEIDTA